MVPHEERAFARGGTDLELRPTELLHLEAVLVFLALGGEGQGGAAEVHGRRKLDLEVEAAEGIDGTRPLRDLVVLSVLHRVADLPKTSGRSHVARSPQANAAHPALDLDLFARAVHLPVVGHVEAELVASGLSFPTLTPPPGTRGEHRDVTALSRDEDGARDVG